MPSVLYNHWYSKAEIDAIIKAGGLNNPALVGYYLETDGKKFRLIHDRDTVLNNEGKRTDRVMGNPWGQIDPIVKRTPQQRLDSLTKHIIADCMREGTVAGLSDEKMSKLLGRPWVTGQSIMTQAVAQQVAAFYLTLSEKKRNEHESQFVVKPSQNDIPQ